MIAAQTSMATIRVLNSGDLASALELSSVAGWNQTVDDWNLLMRLPQAHRFAIEVDGQVVSTTTLVSYEQQLAWIGMVLTKPEYRGRGFARRLFAHVLDYAALIGIQTLKLDATEQGKPLYEGFGFQVEQAVERWVRPGDSATYSHKSSSRLSEELRRLDIEAFGADRSPVLDQLANRGDLVAASDAFSFTRGGRVTSYLGPCVALDPYRARALIRESVAASGTSWSWDLLPGNAAAVDLARQLGFTQKRLLTRMSRGEVLRRRDDMVYAIAGFELG